MARLNLPMAAKRDLTKTDPIPVALSRLCHVTSKRTDSEANYSANRAFFK